MSYDSRRLVTSPGSTSRKRKEREPFYSSTSPKPLLPVSRTVNVKNPIKAEPKPLSSNRLLAGYMAYEFLTKGTLLGEKYDPARAEAVPVSLAEPRKGWTQAASNEAEPSGKPKPECYNEVANLLKSDGAHIPGVVNPTQLSRWIQN